MESVSQSMSGKLNSPHIQNVAVGYDCISNGLFYICGHGYISVRGTVDTNYDLYRLVARHVNFAC